MPVFSGTVTEPTAGDPTTTPAPSHNNTVDLTPPSIDTVPSFASAALPPADPSGLGFNSALNFGDPTPGATQREELRDEPLYSPTPGDSNYLAIGNDVRPGYDETNLSDSFHAVNKGTALNPGDLNAMRSFLSTNDNLEHQSLNRALADLDRLGRTDDASQSRPSSQLARHEAFDNFQDRYVSAFAATPNEANRMDQKLDLVQTALLGETEQERDRALKELKDNFGAGTANADVDLVNAVQNGGLGQLNDVVTLLRQRTADKMTAERAEHSDSRLTTTVEAKAEVLKELTRANNQLVADLLILEGVDTDAVMGLLQSDDPGAIDAAMNAAVDDPHALAALLPYKAQQLFNQAQFGPDAERAGKLTELKTILETRMGVPAADLANDAAIIAAARGQLPIQISNPILEHIDERTSGQIVMTEYSQMPMRERVAAFDALMENFNQQGGSFKYQGDAGEQKLLDDLQKIYAGMDDVQAREFAVEYSRYHNGRTPTSMLNDKLSNMSYETAGTARLMLNGVMPNRYANAISTAHARGDSTESRFVHDLMTEQQRGEAYEVIQSYLNSESIAQTPAEFLGSSYMGGWAATPSLTQALPGTTGGAVTPPIGRLEGKNNEIVAALGGLPDDLTTLSDQQRYETRQKLLGIFKSLPPGTRRDDTLQLLGANPELPGIIEKLESTADYNPGTTPPTTVTVADSRNEVTELLVMMEGITVEQLTGAAPGLAIDTSKLQSGLAATATAAEHTAALAELAKLPGGLDGPRHARALNILVERQSGKSITDMVSAYNTAHPATDLAGRQRQADLLLTANGVNVNDLATRLARTGPHAAAVGAGTALSFSDIGRISELLPENVQGAFGVRLNEVYKAKTGHTIEADYFTDDASKRDRDLRTLYGNALTDDVAQSVSNLQDVLSQNGQGRNVDSSFLQAVKQIDRVAQSYPAGPEREAFLQRLNEEFKQNSGGKSIQAAMEETCSSAALKAHGSLIGLDFSKIESTPARTGAETDTKLEAAGTGIVLADIVTDIKSGSFSVDDLAKAKQDLIDKGEAGLAEALPGRIAARYRATPPNGEIDLSKITITDPDPNKRMQVVAAFYGDTYTAQMDSDMQALNAATTPEELENALRGVPNLELFAAHYEYVTGHTLRADVQTKLDTADKKTEFNSLFANEIGSIGGNF